MPDVSSARQAALFALGRWRDGVRAEDAVRESFAKYRPDVRDRGLAMELVYGVVRNLKNLDFVIGRFIKKAPKGPSPLITDILRLAAYQVLYLDRVPEHAAVFEAVEQAKAERLAASKFVNGVLRSFLRGHASVVYPDLDRDPVSYLAIKYSFPYWLVARWVNRFGPVEAESLMRASNSVPPLTLRVNTLKASRDSFIETLTGTGIEAVPTAYSSDGVTISGYPDVAELPGYKEGIFAVQDEAAQLVSLLVSPHKGQNILDACAAPGGKSCHLAALSGDGAAIVAADKSIKKLGLLKESTARLGIEGVSPLVADASLPMPFKVLFDGVLLDAPCSATGVIRRRPEIKYLRKEGDIARLSALQGRMLDNLAALVKPGGALVYATCSTEPEEGEGVIEGFLAVHPEYALDDTARYLPEAARWLVTDTGYLRTYPHRHGTDGFFAVRLVKKL